MAVVLLAFSVATLMVIAALAWGGSGAAFEILAFFGGVLIGGALAYLICSPISWMTSSLSRLGQTTASRILGLSLAVGLMLAAMRFTGASLSLDESGRMGAMILGLAFGSVMGTIRRLSPPPIKASKEGRKTKKSTSSCP